MIKPNEAREICDRYTSGEVTRIENHIDEAISTACITGNWPVTIALSVVRCNRDVLTEVCAKYQSNGWRIMIVSDQREGDFVQVERP